MKEQVIVTTRIEMKEPVAKNKGYREALEAVGKILAEKEKQATAFEVTPPAATPEPDKTAVVDTPERKAET